MTTEISVKRFLTEFKYKLSFFGVIYMQRDKNIETMFALELTTAGRTSLLQGLKVEDYYRGPSRDYDNGPDLWEFGLTIKKSDIYIKITMGHTNMPVICISFHLAEREIVYPFK